jgi:UDP-N-acetylmuramyl pentapeptide phosphotransferase/UDP-N-acetylglucosamine-1-phosphate transferase
MTGRADRAAGRFPSAGRRRALLTGVLAAEAARGASSVLRASPPGGRDRWTRTNHRGEPISLLEGPAFVLGAVSGIALAPAVDGGRETGRARAAALVVTAAAGGLGAYDDLAEGSVRKGLAGHLGALRHGEVTTGAVKILGLAAAGLVSAALVGCDEAVGDGGSGGGRSDADRRRPGGPGRRLVRALLDAAIGGAVVAGSANLLNLLDLRPGRALKVVLAAAPATVGSGPAAVPLAAALGSAVALLPDDLAERTMLGDTGANAAGALLGLAAVQRLGRNGRLTVLAGLVGLTMASERVSFTAVIERTPALRALDELGRRKR